MPLLRRQVFQKAAGTERLRDSDEVFFCEPTGEIFSSYEDYFHRVMLISSIVWSCALTGRPNLTYAEALESEKAARKLLKTFPDALKGPFLLVASHTKRTSINEMHEDVYSYIKDQLFKGEVVDALDPSGKTYRRAKIVAVTLHSNSPSKQNGELPAGSSSVAPGAPIMLYTMASNDGKGPSTWITLPEVVKRDRSSITRDKCKLFLKQHVEAGPGGILRIKERSMRQYVEAEGWTNDQVFFGSVPDFELSRRRKDKEVRSANKEPGAGAEVQLVEGSSEREVASKGVASGKQQQAPKGVKRKKATKNAATGKGGGSKKEKKAGTTKPGAGGKGQQQMNITKYLDAQSLEAAAAAKAKSMTEELERLKARAAAEAAAKKRHEEEKALLTQQTTLAIKRYNLVLDDLELTDQRVVPVPRRVSTLIEEQHFSDFVFILEFMNSFTDLLSLRNKFPNGLTMELLERALLQREVNGPLGDILQVLLSTIFAQQAEEENEVDVRYDRPENIAQKRLTVPEQARARDAAVWIEKHFSTPLNELPMDSTTISELLRLHFLSSGALVEEKAAKHRYCNRGGYNSADDPGLRLVQDFPHIFRALRSYPVYQLPVGDVIQLLCCLIHQLLTYSAVRELVEERVENARNTRIQFQSARVAQRRLTLKTGSLKYLAREEFKKELAAFQGSEPEREQLRKQLQEKLDEQIARIDTEAQQKLKILHQQSEKLKEDFFDYQIYLGTDRSFRNYWLFESLPGLFVQHDRTLAGRCLDRLTPNIPSLANCATEQRRKFITKCIMQNGQQQQPISSEPGEEIYEELLIRGSAALEEMSRRGAQNAANPATVPTVAAGTAADEAIPLTNDDAPPVIVIDLDSPDEESPATTIKATLPVTASSNEPPTNAQLMMCTADSRTCPVHGQPGDEHAGPSWGYFATADELDALIRSLNVRGLREKQLRETLECERDLILSHIANCPQEKLSIERQNRMALLAELVTRHQKRYDAPNFNYPPGTEPNEIMEAVFRDNLLELEAKITVGYLGVMKVRDREAWRKAIMSNEYDPQTDESLQWGQKRLLAVTNAVAKASGGGGGDEGQPALKEEPLADGGGAGAPSPSHKSVDEGGQQGRGSDDESDDEMERLLSNARDPGYNLPEVPSANWNLAPLPTLDDTCSFPLHDSETLQRSVHTLARALLQIEQCIEQKFLRHPFGPKKDHKDRTVMLQKQSQGLKNLVKWEVSLMRSTSFAQLFLHYNVLYDAIYWSRSAERISCMICRRKVDPDLTLLCDECNRACHIYCLKPKLKEVPAGDWFCMKCRPENFKAKQGPAKKKKPMFQWEDRMDEEKEDESSAEEEDEEGSLGGGTADQYIDSDEEYAVGKVTKQGGGTKAASNVAAAKLPPTSKATNTAKVTTTRNSRSAAAAAAAAAATAANGGTGTAAFGKQHHHHHQQHADDDGFDEDYEEQEAEQEDERSANGESRESTVERATTPNEERRESRRRAAVTSGTKRNASQKEADSSSSKRPRRSATKRSTSLTNTIKISPKMVKAARTSGGGGGSKRHRDEDEDDDDYELGDSENEPLVIRVSTRHNRNSRGGQHRRSSHLNGNDRNGGTGDELECCGGFGAGSRRSRRTADDLPLNSVALYTLIDDILKHPNSWPFNRPVSAKEVPDYYSVIKTPMDFARIKSKLNMGDYKINEQMLSDVQLVFRNCDLYNTDETDVYRIGRDLERYVVKRCKELNLPFQPSDMQKSAAAAAAAAATSSPANGAFSSTRNLNGSAVQSPNPRYSHGGGDTRR